MENNGWVKLHRKIVSWEWYGDANTFRLFLHLLLTANHEKKKWRGREIEIGQKVTSFAHLAEELGLGVHQVRVSLNKLKMTGEVTSTSSSKYSVITIRNWKQYQQVASNKANEWQASDKQVATNKNIRSKEVKNTDTDIEQRDAAQTQRPDAPVVDIIEAFKLVNPDFQRFFKNKTERKACEDLIKIHGFEQVMKVITQALPKTNGRAYMPTITSPYQLATKWAELAAAIRREGERVRGKVPEVIT